MVTAEAIKVATREFSAGTLGTAPPVQQGAVLVVLSRAPLPNAPVTGIRGDGTVILGRAPRIELVRNAQGVPVNPAQVRFEGMSAGSRRRRTVCDWQSLRMSDQQRARDRVILAPSLRSRKRAD